MTQCHISLKQRLCLAEKSAGLVDKKLFKKIWVKTILSSETVRFSIIMWVKSSVYFYKRRAIPFTFQLLDWQRQEPCKLILFAARHHENSYYDLGADYYT